MKKAHLLEVFGGLQGTANALGYSATAVSRWPESIGLHRILLAALGAAVLKWGVLGVRKLEWFEAHPTPIRDLHHAAGPLWRLPEQGFMPAPGQGIIAAMRTRRGTEIVSCWIGADGKSLEDETGRALTTFEWEHVCMYTMRADVEVALAENNGD